LVHEAWTAIEHRKHWFVGPAWSEIEGSVDLRLNGQEIADGRFEEGTETIYTARFHLIYPNVVWSMRLICVWEGSGFPFRLQWNATTISPFWRDPLAHAAIQATS
jgi:uncharacterized protein YndB with AHSA1/START domain